MVTLGYLDGLPKPTPGGQANRQVLLQSLIDALKVAIPGWEYETGGRLARTLEPIEESIWTGIEISMAQAIRFLLPFAEGEDLVARAADSLIVPFEGETADSLRGRVARAPIKESVGTLDSVEENVRESGIENLSDFQIALRPNRQDIDVWALKSGRVQLTALERVALSEYINATNRIMMGVVATVGEPVLKLFDIGLTVLYNSSEIDAATLRERVNTSMRAYVDSLSIGQTVYLSQISKAANVDGAEDAKVQTPAADVAGVNGTVHVNNLSETAAVGAGKYTLTLTEI